MIMTGNNASRIHSEKAMSYHAAPPAFKSRWTNVGGVPIHSKVSQGPEKTKRPVIVLVHGLGLSHRYMMPVAECLAREYPVWVPDLPGFGDSGKSLPALNVPELAGALAAWLRECRLDQPVLFGNSYGCQVIVDLAARFPAQVFRVVLQGPTTDPEERSWWWQFVRWRQNQPFNPPSMEPATKGDYRRCGVPRLLKTMKYFLNDRIEEKLSRVQAPALVIRGTLDPICNQRWAEEITGRLPHGRLVLIPEVAHTLVFTSPRELLHVTQPFLEEAESGLHSTYKGEE
jgi:2-hydroxy-6-oxonona-2,4-dienedioate hydrolase